MWDLFWQQNYAELLSSSVEERPETSSNQAGCQGEYEGESREDQDVGKRCVNVRLPEPEVFDGPFSGQESGGQEDGNSNAPAINEETTHRGDREQNRGDPLGRLVLPIGKKQDCRSKEDYE
jgi:hypothetical protein